MQAVEVKLKGDFKVAGFDLSSVDGLDTPPGSVQLDRLSFQDLRGRSAVLEGVGRDADQQQIAKIRMSTAEGGKAYFDVPIDAIEGVRSLILFPER